MISCEILMPADLCHIISIRFNCISGRNFIDKTAWQNYNTNMPKKAEKVSKKKYNLEWNQIQLKIAKLLIDGKKTPSQVISMGFSHYPAYHVKDCLDHGTKPPSLDDAYIASAPLPTSWEDMKKKPKGLKTGSDKPKDKELTPAKTGKSTKDDGQKEMTPGSIRFVGIRVDCQFTPIMYLAKQAAAEEWNWPPNMPLEDFLDTVLYWFFKDRGITLQGYVVDEEIKQGA